MKDSRMPVMLLLREQALLRDGLLQRDCGRDKVARRDSAARVLVKVALSCAVVVAVGLLLATGGRTSTSIPVPASEPLVVLANPPASFWVKPAPLPKVVKRAGSVQNVQSDEQAYRDMAVEEYFSRLPKP